MKSFRISGVRDLNFGRHDGRDFDGFDASFVVVHGPNESGKSTLAEFLVWAIGGPWRPYGQNSDAFRRGTESLVHGRLLGTFDGDPIDLDARFELKFAGKPKDQRTGHIGVNSIDAKKLAERFGELSDDDYQLIYRLYGASLGDIGSAGAFSDLFSRFALGSTAAVVNPRQSLEALREKVRLAKKHEGELVKRLQVLGKQIKEAKKAPDEEARLEEELARIEVEIAEKTRELSEHATNKALLERVRDGYKNVDLLRGVEAELALVPTVPPKWEKVASNLVEIRRIVARIETLQTEATGASLQAAALASACGLDEAGLRGHTLTPPERVSLSRAAKAVIDSRADLEDAREELRQLEVQHRDSSDDVARRIAALGLSDHQLSEVDALAGGFAQLEVVVDRWIEEANGSIKVDAQLEGERARRRSIEGDPQQVQPPRARNSLVAVIAVLVVGVLGVVHWAAALVAAVVAAGWILAHRGEGSESHKSTDVARSPDLGLADLERKSGEAHEAARGFEKRVKDALGSLADLVSHPDIARTRIDDLRLLAAARRSVIDLDTRVSSARERVGNAISTLQAAEIEARALMGPRKIPESVLNEAFDEWLAGYEQALVAAAGRDVKFDELARSQSEYEVLISAVADDADGLVPRAVVGLIEEMHRRIETRREVEFRLNEARTRVEAADMNSPVAREILDQCQSVEAVEARIEVCKADESATQSIRDGLVEDRKAKTRELHDLQGVEVLPGLLLQQGEIEEDLEEARQRLAALDLAFSVLGDVIDSYERNNQDPVVRSASSLVAGVVPDWGSVIMTRDKSGNPMLLRDGTGGRLGENAISDGGRALLYLGIRLAFAQQDATKRGIALPIICDDPLIHFDDAREEAAIQLLHRISAEHQVVLFTCERATRDLAASLGASIVEM